MSYQDARDLCIRGILTKLQEFWQFSNKDAAGGTLPKEIVEVRTRLPLVENALNQVETGEYNTFDPMPMLKACDSAAESLLIYSEMFRKGPATSPEEYSDKMQPHTQVGVSTVTMMRHLQKLLNIMAANTNQQVNRNRLEEMSRNFEKEIGELSKLLSIDPDHDLKDSNTYRNFNTGSGPQNNFQGRGNQNNTYGNYGPVNFH